MKEKFIISTTDNIEGGVIEQYIDVICTNIVIGTNFFSDFAASFTDFFGGRSDSYRRKLELIYKEAQKKLQNKAIKLGANAIIGFKVDFDEISGKDKSMFMVSVCGTACKIKYNENIEHSTIECISQLDVDKEIKRRLIIKQIQKNEKLNEDWAQFLIEYPQIEITKDLILMYVKSEFSYDEKLSNLIKDVLNAYPKSIVIPIIYTVYLENENKEDVIKLLKQCSLFDANSILNICKKNIHDGIKLLSINSDYYNSNEISKMNELCDFICNLPNTGRIEKVTTGIFNKKEEEKFICEQEHKNAKEKIFCEICGLNIKGMNSTEVKEIENFKEKVEVLNFMNNNN